MTRSPATTADWPVNLYLHEDEPASFRRSRDQWGEFSNMAGRFPITVNDLRFQSSEGLYQALKFPQWPSLQQAIACANSGYSAKRVAYDAGETPYNGWDRERVDAMRVALAFKIAQNPRFATILLDTGNRDIVEDSVKDAFWGANPVPEGFRGANVLGRLLMELRETVRNAGPKHPSEAADKFAQPAFRHDFKVARRPLDAAMLTASPAGVPAVNTPS